MEAETISFNFITHPDLRASLEADYQELTKCYEAGAWKATQVLAGSIIETLLTDALIADGVKTEKQGFDLNLGQAVSHAKKNSIISERTEKMCDLIREYRNLIHPGVVQRLGEQITMHTAGVAKSLVGVVRDDLEKSRKDKYGYTAEQIIQKLVSDPLADSVFPDLLEETNKYEKERLLFESIPETFMSMRKEWNAQLRVDPEAYMPMGFRVLMGFYRAVFDEAPDDIKRKATGRFAAIILEADFIKVYNHGCAFFRARDLKYATARDAARIKKHLIDRIISLGNSRTSSESPFRSDPYAILDGIGPYLEEDEVEPFVEELLKKAAHLDDIDAAIVLRTEYARLHGPSGEHDPRVHKYRGRIKQFAEVHEGSRKGEIALDILEGLGPFRYATDR